MLQGAIQQAHHASASLEHFSQGKCNVARWQRVAPILSKHGTELLPLPLLPAAAALAAALATLVPPPLLLLLCLLLAAAELLI